MGYLGAYDLRLYCDHPDCIEKWDYQKGFTFVGNSMRDSKRRARKEGWTISNAEGPGEGSGLCFCPEHSK